MAHFKKSQISSEYLVIIGFVTFVIIGILGIAFFYTGAIKDRMRINQITNFASKIISTSESLFYSGKPSKATVSAYLPDGITGIQIAEQSLIFTVYTSSGENKISFPSKVPITGNIIGTQGVKKITIEAQESAVSISPA